MHKCCYEKPFREVACSGSWWIAKDYFGKGRHNYACAAHAQHYLSINPFGPRWKPEGMHKALKAINRAIRDL